MATDNVCTLLRACPASQVLLADRNPHDAEVLLRAIRRTTPDVEVRHVTNLPDAARVLAHGRIGTVLVGSSLDDEAFCHTLRRFALEAANAVLVAMLERWEDATRREALQAGATYACSKADLLVAQLRYEFTSRRDAADLPRHPRSA